jgi:hypothetical protein
MTILKPSLALVSNRAGEWQAHIVTVLALGFRFLGRLFVMSQFVMS